MNFRFEQILPSSLRTGQIPKQFRTLESLSISELKNNKHKLHKNII